jgi:hypothetical protein
VTYRRNNQQAQYTTQEPLIKHSAKRTSDQVEYGSAHDQHNQKLGYGQFAPSMGSGTWTASGVPSHLADLFNQVDKGLHTTDRVPVPNHA